MPFNTYIIITKVRGNMPTLTQLTLLLTLTTLCICQQTVQAVQQGDVLQQKIILNQFEAQAEQNNRVQRQQQQIRDSIQMNYGQNTQTLTFNITHMVDFIVKTQENQQIKMTMHVYWKQDNVYTGPEYKVGQNMRILLYQDNYRILFDNKFYITHGIKFSAEKGKVYTIRYLDEGKIPKLVSLQITKTVKVAQQVAKKQHIDHYSSRMANIAGQIKVLESISQFTIVMHEKTARSMNHSICIYMSYLIGEAIAILIIVGIQVRFISKLLIQKSIV